MNEKELAADILSSFKESADEVKEALRELKVARGFFAIVKAAAKVLPSLLRNVEARARARLGFDGAKKRAVALEIILAVLPPLPWWAPEWLVRMVLGRAIDAAVSELNKKFGKNW